MDCRDILNHIEQGALADLTRDDLTAGAAAVLSVSAKTASVLAVVVARLRAEYITGTEEWISYCRESFQLEGGYLHHLHKIGRMLLNVTCDTKLYNMLFALDTDKQLAVSQIPAEKIDGFTKLQTKPLARMTRAEVRAAVALFLGRTAAPEHREEQPDLPGFDSWLDWAPYYEEETARKTVNDDATAEKSFAAGCLLLGAALDYQRRREIPDARLLAELKAELLDEVQSIENILAGVE